MRKLHLWAWAVMLVLAPTGVSAITSDEIFQNLRPEVETEVYINGPTLTGAVYNTAYQNCGVLTYSLRAAEFNCSGGTCPGQNVKGNSFAMGYFQPASNHFYSVVNSGYAIGWHSLNYGSCGNPSGVAGAQCATMGAQAWGLDLATYGNTQALSQQGIPFDCPECLVTGDLIMKVSTDQAWGHTMVFLNWWDEDHLYYTVAEICETYGRAVYSAREVATYNPSTGYRYYRHPELESPWALIDRSSYENGQVAFSTSREVHCDGFRLQASRDGNAWTEGSAFVPARGGNTTYRVAPSVAAPYYRIQSKETTIFNSRWLNHDEVSIVAAKPVTPTSETERGRPILAVVNMSSDPNHPGFADYLGRLRTEGGYDDAHLDIMSRGTADGLRSLGRTVKYWRPDMDHVWMARDDRIKKSTSSPPVKKLLLMAPSSLGLPLDDWRTEKEYEGWTVWVYTYPTGNWTMVINTTNSMIAANGITHVTAFGQTKENNGAGTTVPGSYVADPDSSVAWWTNNVLTYTWIPANVAFGIIPCSSVSDFWSAYDRMLWRQYAWSSYSWIARGGWVLDEDANGVDGELAWDVYRAIDDSMQVQAPGQWWQWERMNLRDSQIAFGCDNRGIAAENHLNGVTTMPPALVSLYGTVSRPDGPGKWLSMTCPQWPYDPANLQYTGIYTDFLGLTCGSAGIDLTSQASVAASMDALYYRGADLYIGPTRSIGQGYASYYLDVWQRLWHTNYQPQTGATFTTMGQLHLACVDSMIANFATGEAGLIANSIILLGDPTALPPGYWYDVPTSVKDGPTTTSNTFGLEVFPNPFNPNATIRYVLTAPGATRLAVYSVTGELVAMLVDDFRAAGPHETVWTANGVSSGVYFCHLTSGGKTATRRLVLLK